MLGVELGGIALGRGAGHQFVPPIVAVGHHVDLGAGAANDDRFFDRGGFFQAFVDRLLERNLLAPPPAAVGRDDQLRLGVVVAVGDGVGAEAAEDDRVRRPDPRQASMAITSSGIIGM